jgi:leucyl/phenylalanyl-tRNA--protein transferase
MTSDCVAVGADLEPSTVIEAYRHGAFPMPHDGALLWWSPVRRGILKPEDLRVSRSLRKSAQQYVLTFDTDFAAVLSACADPARPGAWIDDDIRGAYVRLHELGWAHSVETRDADGVLVGGLYGLQVGRLFAGESMFHRARDASKVALMGLVEIQSGGLIDVQWSTNHLASLGVVTIDRANYLRRLGPLVNEQPPAWPTE